MDDWSTLSQEARRRVVTSGPRCQVGLLLEHLDEESAGYLREALADRGLRGTSLHLAIRKKLGSDSSFVPSLWSVGNHRRGNCRCGS